MLEVLPVGIMMVEEQWSIEILDEAEVELAANPAGRQVEMLCSSGAREESKWEKAEQCSKETFI